MRNKTLSVGLCNKAQNIPNYLDTASDDICVLVQIESKKGLENIDEILTVDGIDGIFIGPADLSAALGYRGNPAHPVVQNIIVDLIQKIRASGKAAGILSADEKLAQSYLELGTEFVAVGVDTSLLMKSMKQVLAKFKKIEEKTVSSPSVY